MRLAGDAEAAAVGHGSARRITMENPPDSGVSDHSPDKPGSRRCRTRSFADIGIGGTPQSQRAFPPLRWRGPPRETLAHRLLKRLGPGLQLQERSLRRFIFGLLFFSRGSSDDQTSSGSTPPGPAVPLVQVDVRPTRRSAAADRTVQHRRPDGVTSSPPGIAFDPIALSQTNSPQPALGTHLSSTGPSRPACPTGVTSIAFFV